MKLPDLYRDWRIVAGLVLILLGAGNWVVGFSKTQQYGEIIARTSDTGVDEAYRSFDELDAGEDRGVLQPFTRQERQVSYATVHMDFYHATFIIGQILFALGLVVTLVAFLGAIRRDARRAAGRSRARLEQGTAADGQ